MRSPGRRRDGRSRARSRHQGPAVDKRPLAIPSHGARRAQRRRSGWPRCSRRCWEGLQSGASAVSVRDAVAILGLAHEAQHDDALTERDADRRPIEEWQHGPWIIRNTIVRHYAQDAWAAISAEVRKHCPAAPPVTGSRAGTAGCPFRLSVVPAASPPASPPWRRRRRAAPAAFPAQPARPRGQARGAGHVWPAPGAPGAEGGGAGQLWVG